MISKTTSSLNSCESGSAPSDILLKDGERIDDLHRNGLRLIQRQSGFRFGTDAVLLAAFAKAGKHDRVMDFCTGSGVIPILMSARTEAASLFGMEINPETADTACRSVSLNCLDNRVQIVCGDIRDVKSHFEASSFQVVTANPPYIKGGGTGKDEAKASARHEILCGIQDIAASAAWLLSFNGSFYLVHRPDRLMEVLSALREARLEPKALRFVHSFIDRPPVMVLIKSVYGGKPHMSVMPPLVIHEPGGSYTTEAKGIYYE